MKTTYSAFQQLVWATEAVAIDTKNRFDNVGKPHLDKALPYWASDHLTAIGVIPADGPLNDDQGALVEAVDAIMNRIQDTIQDFVAA